MTVIDEAIMNVLTWQGSLSGHFSPSFPQIKRHQKVKILGTEVSEQETPRLSRGRGHRLRTGGFSCHQYGWRQMTHHCLPARQKNTTLCLSGPGFCLCHVIISPLHLLTEFYSQLSITPQLIGSFQTKCSLKSLTHITMAATCTDRWRLGSWCDLLSSHLLL